MQRRTLKIRIALLLGVVAVLAWAVPRYPIYQEWRLSHLPLAQLERECSDTPDDYRLLYYTGKRLNERGRYAEALPLLLQSARLHPDEARIRDALAQAQMPLGQTGEAFNQLAQYVGTHPESAEGHLFLGKFYQAMKSGKRAQEELERAVTLNPELAEGWAALADVRSEFTPDGAATLDAARHAARLRPESAEDHLRLAVQLAAQHGAEAHAEFARAVALAPRLAEARRLYADYLLSTGAEADRAGAEVEARRAIVLDPAAPTAYRTLGQALMRRRADTEAIAPLTRAVVLDPYDSVAPQTLFTLCRRQHDLVGAGHWERVWQQRRHYLRERQTLMDAALAAPQDHARSHRLAQLLGRHGEMVEALRYQGLAQGKLSDAPSVLLATASDLADGGYAVRALPLARRALDTAEDTAQVAAARRTLTHIQALLSTSAKLTAR